MQVVDQIYKLRHNFVLIGLTGRTGSGCTTVANILTKSDISDLRSEHSYFSDVEIDNDVRKNRIVNKFIRKNWKPFTLISASNIIFYYALLLDFDDFMDAIANPEAYLDESSKKTNIGDRSATIKKALSDVKQQYKDIHDIVKECDEFLSQKKYYNSENVSQVNTYKKLICEDITSFRDLLKEKLSNTYLKNFSSILQIWGNNIRRYNSVSCDSADDIHKNAPSCLAHKINQFVKAFRQLDKQSNCDDDKTNMQPTRIVIDALRNPYEVIYFRERYSAFYLFSVNTTEDIRFKNLADANYRKEDINAIDEQERSKHDFTESYQLIDIDRCIELSDVFITHNGTPVSKNKQLINQIFRYVALILHPGLVQPSSLERVMQVAYTAKLNSGCLSRQVGAALTNSSFSIVSVGWNASAEGQTPCTLRNLDDLVKQEDSNAYSDYEKDDESFRNYILKLSGAYNDITDKLDNIGMCIPYCFKDIYTSLRVEKEKGNQVHTRSLHAEENAFLQLSKYGTVGIKGGALFTTASCCELCAKKAYQLGIKQIYYIDTYPGISNRHILNSGPGQMRPQMILFHGAVGRAYINLYNPFVPLKDEIKAITGVNPKCLDYSFNNKSTKV